MENLIGKSIEFHASRIIKGNPVKGKLVSINDEWIEVELEKEIEGLVTVWGVGDRKSFRKSLIYGAIKEL